MKCSDFENMLDLYIDNELDESQRHALESHASQCKACREKLEASEQLRTILSHMNDDIFVPLPTQAAWRNAVRAEAKRSRQKKIFSICGSIAAVCVLTFGITAMLGNGSPDVSVTSLPRIETDGIAVDTRSADGVSPTAVQTRGVDYIACAVETESLTQAYEYLCDAIAEYGGVIEQEIDGDAKKIFVQIPGESAQDFISTVYSLDSDAAEANAIAIDQSAASVGICITITGA